MSIDSPHSSLKPRILEQLASSGKAQSDIDATAAISYLPAAMCGRLLLLSSALVFSLASWVPAADPVAPAQVPAGTGTSQPPAALVVVLRNGEILSGHVKQE